MKRRQLTKRVNETDYNSGELSRILSNQYSIKEIAKDAILRAVLLGGGFGIIYTASQLSRSGKISRKIANLCLKAEVWSAIFLGQGNFLGCSKIDNSIISYAP